MSDKTKEEPDYTFKVVMGGDSGVGKTSLMKRLLDDEFNHQRAPTFGVDYGIYNLRVDDCLIKAQIWDTAGQERYRAIAPAYYRGSVGAILVYDISYYKSFERISGWLSEVRKPDQDTLVMLIGNKTDMRPVRAVTTSEASLFAENNDLFFMEASAMDAHNVTEAFDTLLRGNESNKW